uniref:Uncharacterized protein n=1 Tax=Trichobilharzia regenti TaxID=157069 RepID=A0AA85J9M0_TRIRE
MESYFAAMYWSNGHQFYTSSIVSPVPRIENVQLQSGKIRNVTWEQESAFCSKHDFTVIFGGQENKPLEMIIVQGDEKKYSLRSKVENQLIFTISHRNRFSLPKLEHIITEDVGEGDSVSTEVMSSEAVGEEASSSTEDTVKNQNVDEDSSTTGYQTFRKMDMRLPFRQSFFPEGISTTSATQTGSSLLEWNSPQFRHLVIICIVGLVL